MNNFLITVAVKLIMITGGDHHVKNIEEQESDYQKISIEEVSIPDTINDFTDSLKLPMPGIEK